MTTLQFIGTTLSDRGVRRCGVCGDPRELSKAHVPPRSAGNSRWVERAPDSISDGIRRPGRWSTGGLWVRGLCRGCNSRAGLHFDPAYTDFADQVRLWTSRNGQRLRLSTDGPPPVSFAPGLVARSVMFGMFAINPRLRELFPELAHDLAYEAPGEGPVRWPDRCVLRVGLSHPGLARSALLTSGISSFRVMTERVYHLAFADIVFPPLLWSLVPEGGSSEPSGMGPQITDHLPIASEWIQYTKDRTSVDLRNIAGALPATAHPVLVASNDWIEMLSTEGDGRPVVVYGRLP